MNTSVFPISMQYHILFAGISFVFFLLQFFRTRRWYQPVMAVAVAASLLIYINEQSNTLFYGVGIAEGILLILALVLSFVQSARDRKRARLAEAEGENPAEAAKEQPSGETAETEQPAETEKESSSEEAAVTENPAETEKESSSEEAAEAEKPAESSETPGGMSQ